MRVTFNGFKPLVFTTVIPFDNGDEVQVCIKYEKLANYCHHCFKLTHLAVSCPELCGLAEQLGGKKDENLQGLDL